MRKTKLFDKECQLTVEEIVLSILIFKCNNTVIVEQGFLNLNTTDQFGAGQVFVEGGCPVHYRIFSSGWSPYPLAARMTRLPIQTHAFETALQWNSPFIHTFIYFKREVTISCSKSSLGMREKTKIKPERMLSKPSQCL